MRISDWSSDVCASDLAPGRAAENSELMLQPDRVGAAFVDRLGGGAIAGSVLLVDRQPHVGVVGVAGTSAHRIDVDNERGGGRTKMIEAVGGVSRDAALAGTKASDQRQAPHFGGCSGLDRKSTRLNSSH